jgi:hypothetical protein
VTDPALTGRRYHLMLRKKGFRAAAGGTVTFAMAREDNFGGSPTVYANADRARVLRACFARK